MTMFKFEFGFGTLANHGNPATLPFCIDTDGEEIAREAHEAFKEAMWEAFKLSRSGEQDVSIRWTVLPEGVLNEIGLDPMVTGVIDNIAFDFSKMDMYRVSDLKV